MVFVVYNGVGTVLCITQNWTMARAALDLQVSKNEVKPPLLEIYSDSDFGLNRDHVVNAG